MKNTSVKKKTVFISYCQGEVEEQWIHKLATALGRYGIECIVDIYDLQFGQDVNFFMEQIKRVDKVLMLLGKTYKEKADNREGGIGVEAQIISNDVYHNVKQTKFVPVIVKKDENGEPYLPYYLESRRYIDFSDSKLFSEKVDELANHIHGFSMVKKPEVKLGLIKPQNKFVKSLKKN